MLAVAGRTRIRDVRRDKVIRLVVPCLLGLAFGDVGFVRRLAPQKYNRAAIVGDPDRRHHDAVVLLEIG